MALALGLGLLYTRLCATAPFLNLWLACSVAARSVDAFSQLADAASLRLHSLELVR